MRKNNFLAIMLVFILCFVLTGCSKTPKTIEKEIQEKTSDDILVSYYYENQELTYSGQIKSITINIRMNGNANILYSLNDVDLTKEEYVDLVNMLYVETTVSADDLDALKNYIINNNIIYNKDEEETQLVMSSYMSFVTIALGNDVYNIGGDNNKFSDTYQQFEDMILSSVNPTYIETMGMISEKVELLHIGQ